MASVLLPVTNERARQLHFISVSVLARSATGPPNKKEIEKAVANFEDMKKKKVNGRAIRIKCCSFLFFGFHRREERYVISEEGLSDLFR